MACFKPTKARVFSKTNIGLILYLNAPTYTPDRDGVLRRRICAGHHEASRHPPQLAKGGSEDAQRGRDSHGPVGHSQR